MPLAPMGCNVQIHEKTDKRGTWVYHSINGWYIRTSPEHYRTQICIAEKTKEPRATDTVQFNHKRITNPTLTHGDKIMKAVADCMKYVRGKGMTTKQQVADLIQIMKDTGQFVQNNPEAMEQPIHQNNNAPVQQEQREQRVPRVQPDTGGVDRTEHENRRVTRSMQHTNNTTQNNNNINIPLPRVDSSSSTRVTTQVPRVDSSSKQSSTSVTIQVPRVKNSIFQQAIQVAADMVPNKPVNNGPATRTRSKLAAKARAEAPPAANTRSKWRSGLQQPTPIPRHLRPTESSTARTSKRGAAHAVREAFNNKKKMNKLHKRK